MAKAPSLFSILLKQPWWVSALAGIALFGIAQMAFPPVAAFVALPFVVITIYVGYQQLRTLSPGKAELRLQSLRSLSWDQFSAVIVGAYQRQGYTVEPVKKSDYDYTLMQQGRVTLLQCRRWKVNQLGVGPLEELANAVVSVQAYNGICITAGSISSKAREFVKGKPITLVTGIALAELVGHQKK